jgi:predicted AAA+ superfamily ATPase
VAARSYNPRVLDAELASRLETAGAVVVEGPKACGKTETARQISASEVLLDIDENARAAAAVNPSLILEGPTPRLIDEWQVEPRIWNHVRRAVDERGLPGQFILAGSAVPADDATRHTGAGRFSRLRLRPMSLFESGASTGVVSLRELLAGEPAQASDPGLTVEALAEEIARGGWPGLRQLPLGPALRGVKDYLEDVSRTDINAVDGTRRDPDRVRRLCRSLARNVATRASLTTLGKDAGGADGPLNGRTVTAYLAALERLFVIEDQPAWNAHLRSRYVLRLTAKRHFVDPSLAVAALETDPDALRRDLRLLGLLFESLVVRDLRVYAQAGGGRVKQYLDSNDLEVDAVVEAEGTWAAFEIKLGGERSIDQAAASLTKFASQVDTDRAGEPATLGVIVGSGYAYGREDGVQVIPIGTLGP